MQKLKENISSIILCFCELVIGILLLIAPVGFIYLLSLPLSAWRAPWKPPLVPPSLVLPQIMCKDLGESQEREEVAWGRIPQRGGSVGTHAAHWKVSARSGQDSWAITPLSIISLWKDLHCLHMHGSRIRCLSSLSQSNRPTDFISSAWEIRLKTVK